MPGEEDNCVNEQIHDKDDQETPEIEQSLVSSGDNQSDGTRWKVAAILNNQQLREELMDYIELQMKAGPHPSCLVAVKQQFFGGQSPLARIPGEINSAPIIPIADMRGVDSSKYSKGERLMRCKLASLYRLVNLRGWNSTIKNHITSFLVNPYGLLYKEVTAGNLIKVDLEGRILDRGNTVLGVNQAGFSLHSAIYSARPDINCVIHIQTAETVAVSVLKKGFIQLTQDALMGGVPCYLECEAAYPNGDTKDTIINSISDDCDIIFVRNHGLYACGPTLETAWRFAEMAFRGCQQQLQMMKAGLDNLTYISEEAITLVKNHMHADATNLGSEIMWEPGALEFEAEMRILDNKGFRTGYVYKAPAL
ncbi:add-1 [Bugula neritina]|uniref:Add-1 n=1 Tax=Bugula neritina TaxID=10212 RepID=A0A7J7J8Z3_BUGNE|nr:add-1 [Bugula neritina]